MYRIVVVVCQHNTNYGAGEYCPILFIFYFFLPVTKHSNTTDTSHFSHYYGPSPFLSFLKLNSLWHGVISSVIATSVTCHSYMHWNNINFL